MKTSASALIKEWKKRGQTWMTVESATGGAIAAELTNVPGASQVFAGALVVYQPQMKQFWLDVDSTQYGDDAVGLEISEALAESALTLSPQVDGVLAITGHFGPGAPKSTDGKVYIAVAERKTVKSKIQKSSPHAIKNKTALTVSSQVLEVNLQSKTRDQRRVEAVKIALHVLTEALSGES